MRHDPNKRKKASNSHPTKHQNQKGQSGQRSKLNEHRVVQALQVPRFPTLKLGKDLEPSLKPKKFEKAYWENGNRGVFKKLSTIIN